MERRKNKMKTQNMENGEPAGLILKQESSLKGDRINIALLFFLYTLQGIPLGLSSAIPMILQNRGVSYRQQAQFSFVSWPFSLKLLWAPIVDSLFSSRMGRRKTWMVPTQYLIGIFMLLLSSNVNQWLGSKDSEPNCILLTVLFFLLNFLAATQDIAVDGWALTMLKKENVGHASTCNSVGQTTGYFLSYVLFMALESTDFCNSYLRSEPLNEGIVTLPGFLFFWGWIFLITTTVVALLKKEEASRSNTDADTDVKSAYFNFLQILKLKPVQTFAIILLTAKIGFSATDSVMSLKLIESGIPKERFVLLAVPLIPLQIVLPLIITKYTNGPKPLNIFIKAYPWRLLFGIWGALIVFITPTLVPDAHSQIPLYYYVLLIVSYSIHQVCVMSMFVAFMAFFAKISDPLVGGTYMTLLNTMCNLGGNWPATMSLWLVDLLTLRQCTGGGANNTDNSCSSALEESLCAKNGGHCSIRMDGYYVETAICFIAGLIWIAFAKKHIRHVQALSEHAWRLPRKLAKR